MATAPQLDDGDRSAVEQFIKNQKTELPKLVDFLTSRGEHWKARVILELTWSYNDKRPKLPMSEDE